MHAKDLERLGKLMALMFSDNPEEHSVAARQFVEAAKRAGIHPAQLTLMHEQDILGRLNRLNAQLSNENETLYSEVVAWREAAPPAMKRRVAEMKHPHFRRWKRFEFLCRRAYGRLWKRGACAGLGLTPDRINAFRRGREVIDDAVMNRLETVSPYRPRKPKIRWDEWMLDRLSTLLAADRSPEEIAASLDLPVKSVIWRISHSLPRAEQPHM